LSEWLTGYRLATERESSMYIGGGIIVLILIILLIVFLVRRV
jgi:hypothetical protein